MINNYEMPIGFTMALAQHTQSLVNFSRLSRKEQEAVVAKARQIKDRDEMFKYVMSLSHAEGGHFS